MIEVFVLGLLILKTIGVIDISWTVTVVISLAMIVTELKRALDRRAFERAIENAIVAAIGIVEAKIDDIEFRLDGMTDDVESYRNS